MGVRARCVRRRRRLGRRRRQRRRAGRRAPAPEIDAFAEYERLLIRARTRAALATKRGRGERTGDVPFGYRLAEDDVHLIEVEQEEAVIRELLRLGAEGLTLRAMCERHFALGLQPRSGTWHPQKVARILRRTERLGGSRANACGDAPTPA